MQPKVAITSPPPAASSGGPDEFVFFNRALETRGPAICPTPYAAVIAAIMLKRTLAAILFAAGMAIVTPASGFIQDASLARRAGHPVTDGRRYLSAARRDLPTPLG